MTIDTARKWFERLLCSHEWTLWKSRAVNFSHFHVDYVDHFIERDRRCLRCGKIEHERYFVPAVSAHSTDDDWSGGVSRAHREGRSPFDWDQRKPKIQAPRDASYIGDAVMRLVIEETKNG